MRSLSISLGCLALAACTSLLGLDATVQDRDGDGVPDGVDTCPEDPFLDQFDSDGDGIGDACSDCATPIAVDLDGDGYDDGCDRCLGPGPMGVDTDGDGLDDGCDPCLGGTGVTGQTENLGGVGQLGVDSNGDGIDDGCEVCFEHGNDADGDLLGDACDGCNEGPPHDEDGDGVADACDNCPVDHNPEQEPGDPGLGLVCDLADPTQRLFFDPFLVAVTQGWASIDAPWVIEADKAVVDFAAGPARRTLAAVTAPGLAWSIVTKVDLVDPTTSTSIIAESAETVIECEVNANGTSRMFITLGTKSMTMTIEASGRLDASAPIVLRLTRTSDSDLSGAKWICNAFDGTTRTAAQSNELLPNASWTLGLIAGGRSRFHWVEALGGL